MSDTAWQRRRMLELLLEQLAQAPQTPVEIRSGVYYPEEGSTDRFVVETRTAQGTRRFRHAKLEDAQSGVLSVRRREDSQTSARPVERAQDEPLDVLRDPDSATDHRKKALLRLMIEAPSLATSFLATALQNNDVAAEWRAHLVQCAEDCQFEDQKQRESVSAALLTVADRCRFGSLSEDEAVAWSALRTAVSLMPVTRLSDLVVLLRAQGGVDMRLVALQCIARRIEAATHEQYIVRKALRDRVHEIAQKFLDPDVLMPGENAAILQNALHALALLGDERVLACSTMLKAMELLWFERQLERRLRGTLDYWIEAGVPESDARLKVAQALLVQLIPATT